MTRKSEWQEANRQLTAEQRKKLGDPPTAEEMLAFTNGELSETEEERIRELLVAYPELAKMAAAAFPAESEPVSAEAVERGLQDVQRRLGKAVPLRPRMRHYVPTTIAAALALVFFGLYVQAESRARNTARGCDVPRILGAPQELESDGSRGPATPTFLVKDGEAYLLRPRLVDQVRYPHYRIELHDKSGAVWTHPFAEADENNAFQIVIPHAFLRPGVAYELRVFGVDADNERLAGTYDMAVAE